MNKIYIKYSMLLICGLICIRSVAQQNVPLKLWYDKPAVKWEEALPLGNGRLGTMLYGNPQQEELQLNEGTVWAGGPNNNINPVTATVIPEIRKLIAEGKYAEAQAIADKNVHSLNDGMPYQSVGSLFIGFPQYKNVTNYYRDLNIEDAVATVS
jgi:alpha-L-fucosidase 2